MNALNPSSRHVPETPTSPTRRWRRAVAAMVSAAGLLAAVAACGGSADKGAAGSGGSATAGDPAGQPYVIAVSLPMSNPFFAPVKLGMDTAAQAAGVRYDYTAITNQDNLGADLVDLLEQAAAKKPDAIVVADVVDSAVAPAVKKIAESGTPVVLMNGGMETYRSSGAIGVVGKSYSASGNAAGDFFLSKGVTNLVCVNAAPTNPDTGVQCQAAIARVTAKGGTGYELAIPTAQQQNVAAVQATIQGYLSSHPDVTGVFASAENPALATVQAAKALNRPNLVVGSTNVSKNILDNIKGGALQFTIDQQPYLQGYYSILMAAQYVKYGIIPSGPVEAGGLMITSANIDRVIAIQNDAPGVRGQK